MSSISETEKTVANLLSRLSKAEAPSKIRKWEYKVIQCGESQLEKEINNLGEAGWEVINLVLCQLCFKVLLKREKKEDYPPSGMAGAL